MISIVIPVFNQLAYTRECLFHIEKYTDVAYELIVIDNGSTDGTGEYLQSISARVIFNSINKGVYAAWNRGIQQCKFDHIVIMNNDILVTPSWASALLQFSRKNPRCVVGPAMREGYLNYPLIEYSKNLTHACRNASRNNELCNFSLVLFHRPFFDEAGLFDDRFFVTRGDDDMIMRLKEKGIGLAVTGSAFVHHYSEKTQEVQSPGFNIDQIRKNDDRLFKEKWGKIDEKRGIGKAFCKFKEYLTPLFEKARFGYPLKTPKPKNERLVNKII